MAIDDRCLLSVASLAQDYGSDCGTAGVAWLGQVVACVCPFEALRGLESNCRLGYGPYSDCKTKRLLHWGKLDTHRPPRRGSHIGCRSGACISPISGYPTLDAVLKETRSLTTKQVDSAKVMFISDSTIAVQKRCLENTFLAVKRRLHELGLGYSLLFPAKLPVLANNTTHFFATPEEVWSWLEGFSGHTNRTTRLERVGGGGSQHGGQECRGQWLRTEEEPLWPWTWGKAPGALWSPTTSGCALGCQALLKTGRSGLSLIRWGELLGYMALCTELAQPTGHNSTDSGYYHLT
ncbi:hypothetical protein NDU88_000997 [Pleurodeles waltl]|uniref:Uncharacterized protein n=1 Tax=Pleurodeles waltl TaxID=8319 RepID=A0AAV7S9N3_PLEWA|nr:hypothetical protein NDU88_000997 [Pleurodeles waltl]